MSITGQEIGKALAPVWPKGQNHLPSKLHGDMFCAYMAGRYITLKRAEMLEARCAATTDDRSQHARSARKHSREAVSYLRLIEKAGR